MPMKLFILGLPGSGKSALARHIARYVKYHQGWSSIRFNDYRILHDMFRKDREKKQFKAAESGGFDVLNLRVFDEALHKLEQKVNRHLTSSKAKSHELIFLEFARNNYQRAFLQFSPTFLKNAYFLYLDVAVDICKQRIRARVAKPRYKDDYPVSGYIFETYYHGDDGEHISRYLENIHGVADRHILAINNNGTIESAMLQIIPFVDAIISAEIALKETV